MFEESYSQEIRQVRDEREREQVWATSPQALAARALVEHTFELAYQAEEWCARMSESFIASGRAPVELVTVEHLLSHIFAVRGLMNAGNN